MTTGILKIHEKDNVAVALTDLIRGQEILVDNRDILVQQDISVKHKFALQDIPEGNQIIMYGIPVGKALRKILKGQSITTSNIVHDARKYSLTKKSAYNWSPPDVSRFINLDFLGYPRKDGRVGTANYWIIVPLVFCENRNVEVMKRVLLQELGYLGDDDNNLQLRRLIRTLTQSEGEQSVQRRNVPFFKNIDGIKFLNHHMGCGGTPSDARALCGLLAGYINHPNVAGATVLSLGCQDAQTKILLDEISKRNSSFDKPLLIFEQQKYGTEKELLSRAIEDTFHSLIEVNKQERKPTPLNKLVIGVECGGSDGFSGLSANPAMGQVSDMLVAMGGTVILSEFPELCGVEQELIERCNDSGTAQRFIEIQNQYSTKAEATGAGFYLNPSPGNIKDGLITDAMKSAGAVKKGGSSPVTDVLDYPEMATRPGLNLLCTPGNDVESTTGLVGAGANIVLFSTGLGTPTGNPIAPVVKISSNSRVANRMHDIIDIDAGTIITGDESIDDVATRIFLTCVEVASGHLKPKAVQNGQDDFIPWKRDVSL